MDVQFVALSLAYLGSAIGVTVVLPQITRIVRHPTMGGVSPWAWALTAIACSLWVTYGVRSASMPQIPGNILLITGAVAIVLLVPSAWTRQRRALVLGVTVLTLVTASRALTPEQVGFLAFSVSLFGMWPQVFETVWVRRGLGPSALSLTANGLKVGAQVCWLSFAVLTMDLPVMVAAVMALSTNGLVTAVEWGRRQRVAVVLPRVVEPVSG